MVPAHPSVLLLLTAALYCFCAVPAWSETAETYSPNYLVDRIYPSMRGPSEERTAYRLVGGKENELLWITGFRATAVHSDSSTEASQEFVCHNTLSFNYPTRQKAVARGLLEASRSASQRLFTISQGQQEVRFPPGFGIPVLSSEPLMLQSQLLNLNQQSSSFYIRQKSETYFIRDSRLTEPMRPLFMVELVGAVPLSSDTKHETHPQESSGPSCLGVTTATKSFNFEDHRGRTVSAHWMVPPGRHEFENYVGKLGILFDTTAHYFLVHLHPFAESIELYDVTAEKLVFRSKARSYPHKRGLASVDHASSVEGTKIFKDHDYRLTSVYHNTTDVSQDAMSMLFIYALDKGYRGLER